MKQETKIQIRESLRLIQKEVVAMKKEIPHLRHKAQEQKAPKSQKSDIAHLF